MYGITTIPLEARILYRKGLDLSYEGKHEAAVRYLRQAIIIAPRFARAYQALGISLARLGREEDSSGLPVPACHNGD